VSADGTLRTATGGTRCRYDGHIFRTSDIRWLIGRIESSNPNTLEGELASRPPHIPRAACFAGSNVVNIPVNRVQDAAPNRYGGSDAVRLNDIFLSGRRLALEPLTRLTPASPHHEVEYEWEADS
jgi:hypothetical protein